MENKIITIAEETYSRAQLIQGRLESEGISCFLTNVNLVQSDVAAGVRIKIREDDKDRAMEIIEEMRHKTGEEKKQTVERLKAIRRILVPVDFSEHSVNACNYALGIANTLKAEVRLLHVYYSPALDTAHFGEGYNMNLNIEKYIRDIYKNASYDMNKLIAKLEKIKEEKKYKHVNIDSRLVNGPPEAVIMDECKNYDPAMLIMGHKGKGESENIILGSVASYVINKINKPVLAVPEEASFKGIEHINNIAYATNFDNSDFKAISDLTNLIKPFRMQIHCVHVETDNEDYWDEVKMKGLKNYFAELDTPDVKCEMIKSKDLVEGITRFIKENDIHILSTTTKKRNFFTKLFNPSMTQELLKNVDIPLLIFHP